MHFFKNKQSEHQTTIIMTSANKNVFLQIRYFLTIVFAETDGDINNIVLIKLSNQIARSFFLNLRKKNHS
jgi:hypothetical protein